MNKTIQSILFGSMLTHCSMLMAMESTKNISENMPYHECPVNYYSPTVLEKLVELVDLPHADGSKSAVNLPLINNPFEHGLMTQTNVTIHPINEEKSTLEVNGFEVVDLSGRPQFVAMLKEFYELDYVNVSKFEQDALKSRYSQLLKAELDQWLKAKKTALYDNAQWTPIQATAVAVRTTGSKADGDKRQPALPLLHADYPDADEFRRYTNLREDAASINPEPAATGDNDFVSYINIWAPTDESVGGMPLAVIDTATVAEGEMLDAVVVPIIDNQLCHNDKFIGRSVKLDVARHKFFSVKNWTRGKVIVFYTFTTPHTAALVKPEITRNSIEIRGFISGSRKS